MLLTNDCEESEGNETERSLGTVRTERPRICSQTGLNPRLTGNAWNYPFPQFSLESRPLPTSARDVRVAVVLLRLNPLDAVDRQIRQLSANILFYASRFSMLILYITGNTSDVYATFRM